MQFIYAAFGNSDHIESSLSGLNTSHDTVTVIFQEDGASLYTVSPMFPRQRWNLGLNLSLQSFHVKNWRNSWSLRKPQLHPDYDVVSGPQDKRLLYDMKAKEATGH